MGDAKVYRFTCYSVSIDETLLAPRAATLEAIQHSGGVALEHTEQEVDQSQLDDDGFVRPARIDATEALDADQRDRIRR